MQSCGICAVLFLQDVAFSPFISVSSNMHEQIHCAAQADLPYERLQCRCGEACDSIAHVALALLTP